MKHQPGKASGKIVRRPSIRFYLVLMNLVLLCLLFPVATLLYINQEGRFRNAQLDRTIKQMRQSLESRSGALVSNMALSAGYAVTGYDYTFLNNMVQQVVSENAEILYCLIMDTRGMAVAHSNLEKVGSVLTGPKDQQAATLLATVFPATAAGGHNHHVRFIDQDVNAEIKQNQILEVLAPIYSGAQLFAVLRCGYSLEKLYLEIQASKQDWTRWSRQSKIYLVSITAIFFTIGVVIAAFFTRAFVRSMQVVSSGVSRVAQGDLENEIAPDGLVFDELVSLSEDFNAMTRQLSRSRRQLDEYSRSLEQKVKERTQELKDAQANLLQQAHEAGMAEMAVGILHNIGNAVTPAKVGLFQLSSRMGNKPLLGHLPSALDEIGELIPQLPSLSEAQKERLLKIISLIPKTIEEEYHLNASEIEQIRSKLAHIESIISLQMRYAHLFGDIEMVDVFQVVEDALVLLNGDLHKRSIRIIKDFTQVPAIRIEKSRLIQIIVNLIKNSYEAMEKVPEQDRTLALSIGCEQGPPRQLVLSVKDSGIGLTPQQKQQLFTFGYSTKAKGSGFGLHSCANYLIAHNGSIAAYSDGKGKGTEFVVRLAVNESGAGHNEGY